MAETAVGLTAGSGVNVDVFSLPDGKVQEAVVIGDGSNNGYKALPTPYGYLRATTEPSELMYDPFDAALDQVNLWLPANAGGGVAQAVAAGVLTLGTGTTIAGYSQVTSIPTFKPTVPSWLGVSFAISLTDGAAVIANTYRFWGAGTSPGSPTAAAPLTDAIGFEMTTAGHLVAVVYAAGARTVIQDLNSSGGNSKQPTDANGHRYGIYVRTDKMYWFIDTIDNIVAVSQFQGPSVQTLPVKFLAIAGASAPGSSGVITCYGVSVWDTGKNNQQLSDGTFPWRKAAINAAGALSTAQADLTASGSITALNANLATGAATAGSTVALSLGSGQASLAIQVTGTFTETLLVQGTVDGVNWITLNYTSALINLNSAAGVTSITAVGIFVANVAGMTQVRVTCSAFTSGTAVVTMRSSAIALSAIVNASLPVGGNTIGTVGVTGYPGGVALADGQANPTTQPVGALTEQFNGTTWDRNRNNVNTTTGDTGAKTVTFNGANQTNYNARGAYIVLNIGTISGTTPTLTAQIQGSADGGTTWFNIPGAVTPSITATGVTVLAIYPDATAVANASVSYPLPRTWRVVYTIGGTTPSFTITNVQVAYIL